MPSRDQFRRVQSAPLATAPSDRQGIRDTLRSMVSHIVPLHRSRTQDVQLHPSKSPTTPTTRKSMSMYIEEDLEDAADLSPTTSPTVSGEHSSPEAALASLSEKTLLDARALCHAKLTALKELNRTAQATLRGLQKDGADAGEAARLEQEVRQREADIKRWASRVRVADSELTRRGLGVPSHAVEADSARRQSQGDPLGDSDK